MRTLLRLLIAAGLLTASTAPHQAALDAKSDAASAKSLKLVVMEAPGCIYCGVFRRDVLPNFKASERARTLDVRFLDINELDGEKLDLLAPVDIVPTFVVVRGTQEIGRVAGYVGAENFFRSISHLLAQEP